MMMHSHTNRIGRARFGVVSAVDPSSGLVKVFLQPENSETGWICDTAASVGTALCYAPAQIGNHVLIETAQGDGDNYVVVARVFDAVTQPATFSCLDGSKLSPGQFGIKVGETEFVLMSDGIKVNGNFVIEGDVTVSGDVKASGISLQQHIHGGVQVGGSVTEEPQ
ncbi:phage-related baseplate assembly protein [Acetobacter oeni LMG 21952]|nr:phage-related baseplate assembly protein [Acetobacter oeni LMG 21952]